MNINIANSFVLEFVIFVAGTANVFTLDADLKKRLRDAEKAHNDSIQAWPRGRQYNHEHLLLIREVRLTL